MRIDFAPMEGLTGYAFRNVHAQLIGGADRYFTPFISANHTYAFQQKEEEDIAPSNNEGICLIPQILTNEADQAVFAIRKIAETGYREININLGCPSPTVTAKGKGAGMLRSPEKVNAFLAEIFERCDPSLRISVKTRLGWAEPEEALPLMDVFNRFPISELIIHARVRKEMYNGTADRETFAAMYERRTMPVVYNGDIDTPEDYAVICRRFPDLAGVMIGRGLIADPFLALKIKQPDAACPCSLQVFHDALYEALRARFRNELQAVGHMKEYWFYWRRAGYLTERQFLTIRKTKDRSAYLAAAGAVFSGQMI